MGVKVGALDQEDLAELQGYGGNMNALNNFGADVLRAFGKDNMLPDSLRTDIKSHTTNKTIVDKDGTYQAIMNDGSRRVFDAQDNLLQGEDAQRAIEAGVNSGIQFEGEKTRGQR